MVSVGTLQKKGVRPRGTCDASWWATYRTGLLKLRKYDSMRCIS